MVGRETNRVMTRGVSCGTLRVLDWRAGSGKNDGTSNAFKKVLLFRLRLCTRLAPFNVTSLSQVTDGRLCYLIMLLSHQDDAKSGPFNLLID